jgi:hypothetical protein
MNSSAPNTAPLHIETGPNAHPTTERRGKLLRERFHALVPCFGLFS